jgi:membrane-associated phospholipid phosphatase
MLLSYAMLGRAVALISPNHAPWLQSADIVLFGGNASVALQAAARPWLTEILSVADLLFHPFIAYGLWFHALRPGEHAALFLRMMGTLWGLGFIGYTWVPAAGPYLEMPCHFSEPLDGWWLTWLNRTLILWGSNRVDCFPSLHCAVSGAILLFEFRRSAKAGWLLTPFVAALWLSTLYLRQHYAVDVLAGAILLAVVWPLVAWWPGYSPFNFGRSK